MKIKSIKVTNFKAIENQELNLNGASAIITGGNNKGKSSLTKGLIDRFRGERPEVIVKEGEEKGVSTMELTDGSKIKWSFTKKTENFSFTTADEIKMTTGVLKQIGAKYFGIKFDIDKFLTAGKAEAKKMVEKLLNVDLSDLEEKYSTKYSERTEVNREVTRLRNLNKVEPLLVEKVDLEKLKQEKESIKNENEALKQKWKDDNEAHQKEAIEFNKLQDKRDGDIIFVSNAQEELKKYKGSILSDYIDFSAIDLKFNELPEAEEKKEITSLDEPEYKDLSEIDAKIENAAQVNAEAEAYQANLVEYNNWVSEGLKQKKKADKLNKELDKIKQEKVDRLKAANIPEEFELTDDGIIYKGLPLDSNQISTSAKYICALKLGSLVLGKIKALHFEASALDKNSLAEIQEWAKGKDYQLLIERPDWNDGPIEYKILED